ncbi:MAG TPA: electron transfer flavoprotein subunit beta/FixA family protein, partial [Fimbriimonadaceae bacterium]|nr:electron transfer flavoprotein subunit beta/FixA family protein [Fimbriimonadaceae bacterium]
RVPDPYAKPRPLPDGSGIDTASLKFEINPFDEIALEAAVRLKEADSTIEIVCVSVGPAACEDQLRKALAMGADRALLVETEARFDALGVAKELEAVQKAHGADLILMGKQATDDDANQVGQMLAARLGFPQATFASKITLVTGGVQVTRETDAGEETLKLPLPALVTADLRLAEPRYIALPAIIKARSKPLDRTAPSVNAAPRVSVVKLEPAPARPPGRKVGSVDELLGALRSMGAIA